MASVGGAARKLTRAAGSAATMTTEAAGAVGGAAVSGVIGGVKGAAAGIQQGLGRGSHSTPAAALTLGALGVAGLVEWPVLLAVGAGALVLKQLAKRPEPEPAPPKAAPLKSVKQPAAGPSAGPRRSPAPKKTTPARQSRSSQTRGRH